GRQETAGREEGRRGLTSKDPAASARERIEDQQQHNRADDGEQERDEAESEVHGVSEDDVPDQTADERTGDADGGRRGAADELTPGKDEPRDRAGEQAEDEPGEDPHRRRVNGVTAADAASARRRGLSRRVGCPRVPTEP